MCVTSASIALQYLSLISDTRVNLWYSLDNACHASADVFCDELGYVWAQRVRYICEFSCQLFVFPMVLSNYLRSQSDSVKSVEYATVTYLGQTQTGNQPTNS